jgi:hypothetical protein
VARGFADVDASIRGEGAEREPTEQRMYAILMAALREKLSDAEIEWLPAALSRPDRSGAQRIHRYPWLPIPASCQSHPAYFALCKSWRIR